MTGLPRFARNDEVFARNDEVFARNDEVFARNDVMSPSLRGAKRRGNLFIIKSFIW